MAVLSLPTFYAPAERAKLAALQAQSRKVQAYLPILQPVLDALPDYVAVLNLQRQIVFANRPLQDALAASQSLEAGLRPGEALGCLHACATQSGCGTTQFCRTCGAVNAILTSQGGETDTRECRMLRANGEALDLRVTAAPLNIGKEDFTLFSAVDISHEKRRRALERIFFHDVLNTAAGILGWAEMLHTAHPEELAEFQSTIHNLTARLIDEIQHQRTLSAAESKQLTVRPGPIISLEVLQRLANSYSNHPAARQRALLIDREAQALTFTSDEGLLLRVLGNMLKNALEACQPGETVTLGCRSLPEGVEFWVHNPGVMPEEVQLQIFQRSFSTKGDGRGLGTYSMRLLGEAYLGGQVSFTSGKDGTTFRLRCPWNLAAPEAHGL